MFTIHKWTHNLAKYYKQDICKSNCKKGSLKMLEPISKHIITKDIQNNNSLKSYKEK
jgi:hypothetical protein